MPRVKTWLSRGSPLGPVWFDVLLAGVLAVYAQVDVWTELTAERVPGPKLVASVGLLLATAPLAWRQGRPLAVLCIVMAAFAVEATLAGEAPVGGEVLFPTLLALYSVAAYADRRRALIGLGVAWVATLVQGAHDPEILSVGDFVLVDLFFFWFLGGGSWLAGRYVRSRRQDASAFEVRAAQLEREREERAREAVIQERARIARELHDVIAHGVSVMGVQAAAAELMLDVDPERAREPLRSVQDAAREAIAELRRLLGVLRELDEEPSRLPQPRLAELGALLDQVRAAGLDVELTREGPRSPLPAGIELSAYRIVQEALTNALKHAGPGHARVWVRRRPHLLEIEVVDDGDAGPQSAAGVNGHGLVGMRERVALYGGTLEAGPGAAGGYSVRARLPLEAES
jgi:signal transduction histidine kinase